MPIELGPVVLSMQKIGQLHTASFTMKDVVHQETQTEPEGPLPTCRERPGWCIGPPTIRRLSS